MEQTDLQKSFVEFLQIEKYASPYTIKYYADDIEAFTAFLRQESIEQFQDVDYRVVRLYLTQLYDMKLSRRSVSRKISSLRSFFRYLEREDNVKQNPFKQIRLPRQDKPIPGFLYAEELEELFHSNDLSTARGQRDQALLELLYASGIRVSECQSLQVKDIDFFLGTILVTGKGRKERFVPFGQFAHEALENYVQDGRQQLLEKTDSEPDALFLNLRGGELSARGMRHVLEKMVEKAALTIHLHPHKLRHTFATHMLNEGADLRTVQELLGHENLSSTQIYTHVTKDHLRQVYMNSHPRANDSSYD